MTRCTVITRWRRAWLGTLLVAFLLPSTSVADPQRVLMEDSVEGAVTSFQDPGTWKRDRWIIIGLSLGVLWQTAFIVKLLKNRSKHRQTEAEATLIAEISSKFGNLLPNEVDREIMDAQHRICSLLDLDFSTLWQWSDAGPGFFSLTHFYVSHAGPQPPDRMLQDQYPWAREQLQAGRIIRISSLGDLPQEAARDRETLRQFGIKSNLALPLAVGGEAPIGILGFGTMRAERDWPDAVVERLQQLSRVFTHALARKRADQALRESESRLATGAELAGLGYYEVDFGEGTCHVDPQFQKICQIPAGEHQGLQALQYWLDHLHSDDRQRVLDEREKLHQGAFDRLSIEYRFLLPDGSHRWFLHLAGAATRDATGQAVRTFGVLRDVTEQHLAELETRELRSKLAHADRVTLLGQLSSALAHELSQPLGAILRNAEAAQIMLQEPSPDLEELRAIIEDILSDDQRASQVIDKLRSLLKRRRIDPQPIAIQEVITEVLSLIHADAAARRVKLVIAVAPGLPMVRGDRIHLQQVLLNLLVNAMDALVDCSPRDRTVRVSTRLTNAATVEVQITDNGPGIPKKLQARLFDPFFTTKTNGMGMGLLISKTIIEAHQGKLWAEHGPEGGARFCFTVPVAGG